jgi:hypothetical protein
VRTLLEIALFTNEISLALLLVAVAESAYKLGDVWRGDEALARGHAASFRAARLLAQVADCDRALLVRDLESLQSALNGLPAKIVGNLGPEGNIVLPSEELPTSSDAGPPLDPSGPSRLARDGLYGR